MCGLNALQDGTPIKFYSIGQDYFGGSHYDEYIYEWTAFKAGSVDAAVFELPDICNKQPQQQQQQRHHLPTQAIALLPGSHQEHKGEAHTAVAAPAAAVSPASTAVILAAAPVLVTAPKKNSQCGISWLFPQIFLQNVQNFLITM